MVENKKIQELIEVPETEIGLGFNLARCLHLFPECDAIDQVSLKMIVYSQKYCKLILAYENILYIWNEKSLEMFSPIAQNKEKDDDGEKFAQKAISINITDCDAINVIDLSQNERYFLMQTEKQLRILDAEQLFTQQIIIEIDKFQLESKYIQDIQWKSQNDKDMLLLEGSDSIQLIELSPQKIVTQQKIDSQYGACFGIQNTFLLSLDKKYNLNFYKDEFKTIEKQVNLLELVELIMVHFEAEESYEIMFYSTRQISESTLIIFGALVDDDYAEDFSVTFSIDENKEIVKCVVEQMDYADADAQIPSLFTFMKFSKTREFGLICHNKQDVLEFLCNDYNCKIKLKSNSMKLQVNEDGGDDTLIRGVAYMPAGELSIEKQEGYEFKIDNIPLEIIWYPPSIWIFSSNGKLYRQFLVDLQDLKGEGTESKYSDNKQKFKENAIQYEQKSQVLDSEKAGIGAEEFKQNFISFLKSNDENQEGVKSSIGLQFKNQDKNNQNSLFQNQQKEPENQKQQEPQNPQNQKADFFSNLPKNKDQNQQQQQQNILSFGGIQQQQKPNLFSSQQNNNGLFGNVNLNSNGLFGNANLNFPQNEKKNKEEQQPQKEKQEQIQKDTILGNLNLKINSNNENQQNNNLVEQIPQKKEFKLEQIIGEKKSQDQILQNDSEKNLQNIILMPEEKLQNILPEKNANPKKLGIWKQIEQLKIKYNQCQRIREDNNQIKPDENPLLDKFSDFNLERIINFSLDELELNDINVNNHKNILLEQQNKLLGISEEMKNVQIHYENLLSIWGKLKLFYKTRTENLSRQQLDEIESKLWPSKEEFPTFKFQISHTFEEIESLIKEFYKHYSYQLIIFDSQKAIRQKFPNLSPQRNINQLEANFLQQQKIQQNSQRNIAPKIQKKKWQFNSKNFLTQKFEPLVENKTEKYVQNWGSGSVVVMQNYLEETNKQSKQSQSQFAVQDQYKQKQPQQQFLSNVTLMGGSENFKRSQNLGNSSVLMNRENQ